METVNHECYVSLEVAKLLKEAGFDWLEDRKYCYWEDLNREGDSKSWFIDSLYIYQYNHPKFNGGNWVYYYRVPLHIAQKWLREVKQCAIIVETHNVQAACVSAYVYCIYPTDAIHPCEHIKGFAEDWCFDTYEGALEAGIKKSLEIILKKGE